MTGPRSPSWPCGRWFSFSGARSETPERAALPFNPRHPWGPSHGDMVLGPEVASIARVQSSLPCLPPQPGPRRLLSSESLVPPHRLCAQPEASASGRSCVGVRGVCQPRAALLPQACPVAVRPHGLLPGLHGLVLRGHRGQRLLPKVPPDPLLFPQLAPSFHHCPVGRRARGCPSNLLRPGGASASAPRPALPQVTPVSPGGFPSSPLPPFQGVLPSLPSVSLSPPQPCLGFSICGSFPLWSRPPRTLSPFLTSRKRPLLSLLHEPLNRLAATRSMGCSSSSGHLRPGPWAPMGPWPEPSVPASSPTLPSATLTERPSTSVPPAPPALWALPALSPIQLHPPSPRGGRPNVTCWPFWSAGSSLTLRTQREASLGASWASLAARWRMNTRFWRPGFGSQLLLMARSPSLCSLEQVASLSLFPHFQGDTPVPVQAGILQVCVTRAL